MYTLNPGIYIYVYIYKYMYTYIIDDDLKEAALARWHAAAVAGGRVICATHTHTHTHTHTGIEGLSLEDALYM
jgi:hypothetical protein